MSHPPKIFMNKTVLFVTTGVEEGLMFPPNPYMKLILLSILARAQWLYPVRVCHFVMEATHIHMILVVDNPADIEQFMKHFKTESAHAVNRLLGRNKRTVWEKGYDSPVLLTKEDVIKKIIYTYQNPTRDNLAETLEDYEGLNTWEMFTQKTHTVECPWVRRSAIRKLRKKSLNQKETYSVAYELKDKAKDSYTFTISPDAWMECFDIVDPEEQKQINNDIIRIVREREKEYSDMRKKEGKKIIPVTKQVLQTPGTPFNRNKEEGYGRRSMFICSDKERRLNFLLFIREQIRKAKEVFRRWRQADYSLSFPEGLRPPSMPKVVELHTAVAYCW